MGFVGDLRYFVRQLTPAQARRLALLKLEKRERKRRLARRFAHPESDAELLERLHLPQESPRRLALWRELWAPLAASPVLRPVYPSGAADRVLAGVQCLFGQDLSVGWPPHWGWRWDGTENAGLFAKDVRSTWEIERLQGILPLAAAASNGARESERYGEAYLEAIASFHKEHPGPRGIAWSSALELGLRLVALAQGIPHVAGTQAFVHRETMVLRMIDRHARWLAADLSLDKVVRGNHLLGELSGLLVAGCLVPPAREAWWGSLPVRSLLESEILHQFYEDGVSVEQSLTYEKFVLEFLTVAGELSRLREEPFTDLVRARLALALRHLEIVTAPDGELPRVGDCDSGRGSAGAEDPHCPARLLGEAGLVFGHVPEPAAPRRRHFPRGGHVVLAPEPGDFVFVRGGPFGWGQPGPSAHSHADWLSPVLYQDGDPILVDSGVFGYNLGSDLRDAFRRWDAHNTILPGLKRGPAPGGIFRWTEWNAVAAIDLGEGWRIQGHVSWSGDEPLLWHRCISYNELRRGWRLEDRLDGVRSGAVFASLHFAPGIEVETAGSGDFSLGLPSGRILSLGFDPPVDAEIRKGWVAPAYGRREPGLVLTYVIRPDMATLVVEILPRSLR